MPRTKNPPLHFDEISIVFGAIFAGAGEGSPAYPEGVSSTTETACFGLVIETIDGKGRSGRDAGNV